MNLSPLLFTILGFCHMGKEVERLYATDVNGFVAYFGESVEDQMTRVSVRTSAVEMIQTVFIEQGQELQT